MPIHDWSRVDAGVFHDLHLAWIGQLRTILNGGLLPAPFYALAEPVLGEATPDVLALRAREEKEDAGAEPRGLEREEGPVQSVTGAPAGVVVQELAPPDPYAALARHILIKDELRGDEVVAVIELVSRGNKSSQRDRDRFVDKAVSLLRERIHLLLVDLHPATAAVTSGFHALISTSYGQSPPERSTERGLEAVSYEVLESCAVRSHVVPLAPGDALPEMPVFLRPHRFVRLPLERTYAEAFQGLAGRFRRLLE